MYRCSEVVRLMASDEYLSCGLLPRLQIWLHVAMCKPCLKYARQLRAIARAVRKAAVPVPPAVLGTARSTILQQLKEK